MKTAKRILNRITIAILVVLSGYWLLAVVLVLGTFVSWGNIHSFWQHLFAMQLFSLSAINVVMAIAFACFFLFILTDDPARKRNGPKVEILLIRLLLPLMLYRLRHVPNTLEGLEQAFLKQSANNRMALRHMIKRIPAVKIDEDARQRLLFALADIEQA